MFAVMLGRYFLIAGGAYYYFWKRPNPVTQKNRIQTIDFTASDIRREMKYSLQTSIIFGLVLGYSFEGISFLNLRSLAYPTSALYDFFSLCLLIALHDTYFYWIHRAVHLPELYQRVHRVHHLSRNPSPWASFSFQLSEAILESIWVIPAHGLFPIQAYVWAIFGTIIVAINVVGHLGVEAYPQSWQTHPILKWLNFSTYHNEHHQFFVGNYGLYFSFWDRVMGTLRQSSQEMKKAET